MEGQAHEVVSIVFKGLAKKKIVFPQNFQRSALARRYRRPSQRHG